MKKFIFPFAFTTILFLASPALSVNIAPGGGGGGVAMAVEENIPSGITTRTQAYASLDRVAKFLFNIFLGLALIFLIIAALFYITAGGNQTQLDKAKNILIYSIVAIVLALLAGGMRTFIQNLILPGGS